MGVKSDKTFEEIVERLVALVTPQADTAGTVEEPAPSSQPASASSDATLSPASTEEDAH